MLVNVIGRFEPSTFSTLMTQLDIEAPTAEIESTAGVHAGRDP